MREQAVDRQLASLVNRQCMEPTLALVEAWDKAWIRHGRSHQGVRQREHYASGASNLAKSGMGEGSGVPGTMRSACQRACDTSPLYPSNSCRRCEEKGT